MKIKIISDGTPSGTKVINLETGEPLEKITSIMWAIEHSNSAVAILTFTGIPVEVVSERVNEDPQIIGALPDAACN